MAGEVAAFFMELAKVPGLIVEIYGDLAKPGVKQVGKALDTVVGFGNTLLLPLSLLNERAKITFQNNMERYRKEMEAVAEEKVIGVAPEIGVPIVEKLTYVQNEVLADLFAKLLASASNSDLVQYAHPSFINVINNLSPDEGELLKMFRTSPQIPFVFAQLAKSDYGAHRKLGGPFIEPVVVANLMFTENIGAYLKNLNGLGIIDYHEDQWIVPETIYANLIADTKARYSDLLQRPEHADRKLVIGKGVAQITEYGDQFLNSCLR